MTFAFGIPQAIYVVLLVFVLVYVARHHGQPRPPWNFGDAVIGVIAQLALVWWGGFFG